MSETKVILITISIMTLIAYFIGYGAALYFGPETLLGKIIHLSFIILFFTSFYSSVKNHMMKLLKGKYDDE